jgi:hypothetical protein
LDDFAKPLAQLGILAELLGEDVPGAEQGVRRRVDLPVGIDEIGRPGIEFQPADDGAQNLAGKRFQAARPGQRGQRLLLGLERQIQVFEAFGSAGGADLIA